MTNKNYNIFNSHTVIHNKKEILTAVKFVFTVYSIAAKWRIGELLTARQSTSDLIINGDINVLPVLRLLLLL